METPRLFKIRGVFKLLGFSHFILKLFPTKLVKCHLK